MSSPTIDKPDTMQSPASHRLPNEIIENIANHTQNPATLAALARVSHRMYELVAPRLLPAMIITADSFSTLCDLMKVPTKGKSAEAEL